MNGQVKNSSPLDWGARRDGAYLLDRVQERFSDETGDLQPSRRVTPPTIFAGAEPFAIYIKRKRKTIAEALRPGGNSSSGSSGAHTGSEQFSQQAGVNRSSVNGVPSQTRNCARVVKIDLCKMSRVFHSEARSMVLP